MFLEAMRKKYGDDFSIMSNPTQLTDDEKNQMYSLRRHLGGGAMNEFQEPRDKFTDQLTNIGVTRRSIDNNTVNFDVRGGEAIYFDEINPWSLLTDGSIELNFDVDRLKSAINELSDDDAKNRALHYLGRVIELSKQFQKSGQGKNEEGERN